MPKFHHSVYWSIRQALDAVKKGQRLEVVFSRSEIVALPPKTWRIRPQAEKKNVMGRVRRRRIASGFFGTACEHDTQRKASGRSHWVGADHQGPTVAVRGMATSFSAISSAWEHSSACSPTASERQFEADSPRACAPHARQQPSRSIGEDCAHSGIHPGVGDGGHRGIADRPCSCSSKEHGRGWRVPTTRLQRPHRRYGSLRRRRSWTERSTRQATSRRGRFESPWSVRDAPGDGPPPQWAQELMELRQQVAQLRGEDQTGGVEPSKKRLREDYIPMSTEDLVQWMADRQQDLQEAMSQDWHSWWQRAEFS